MCGIAGVIGLPRHIAEPAARRMQRALRHRGPDGEGLQIIDDPAGIGSPIVLAHTRLAVIDPRPDAAQPMSIATDRESGARLHLTYNGEVVNFREITADLGDTELRTRSDTEVILAAYRTWGEDAVDRMRGMFAWALVDERRRSVWLCRDRLGVKPLLMARTVQGGLVFASEVRALLAVGDGLLPRCISPMALESYLAQGAVCAAQSFVAGVEFVEPGSWLRVDWSGETLESRRYWSIPSPARDVPPPKSRAAYVDGLGAELRRAVGLHLEADVPIGLFLSGGIDSASLTTIATELMPGNVRTVTVGFDQPDADESDAAARIAKELGTEHVTLRLTGNDVLRRLDAALDALDQPTIDAFNTYFVSAAARDAGLTVALSGVGGDELFGGYATFRDVPRALSLRSRLAWSRPVCSTAARLASSFGGRRTAKIAELFRRASTPYGVYLLRRELFLPAERRALHAAPPAADPDTGLAAADIAAASDDALGLDVVDQVSRFELLTYMRHMLLRDADVSGMAHGLEIRVPLLDHVLLEHVARAPADWRRPGAVSKQLLVDAVGPRLPRGVAGRRKQGFALPWRAWLRGPLRERAVAAACNRELWTRVGVHPDAPAQIVTRFLAGDRRIAALQVLAFIVLEHHTTRHHLRRSA